MTTQAKIRTKKIDGHEYTITVMSTTPALKVGQALTKLVGPVIAAILDNEKNEDIRIEESNMFSQIAATLVYNMEEMDLMDLIKTLLKDSYLESQPLDIEEDFAGRMGTLASVVTFALRENFGDFFPKLSEGAGLKIPTLESLMAKRQVFTPETSNDSSETTAQ